MIKALDAAVAVRMIGACRNFAHAKDLVDSVRPFGSELEALVGEEANGTSPQRDEYGGLGASLAPEGLQHQPLIGTQ